MSYYLFFVKKYVRTSLKNNIILFIFMVLFFFFFVKQFGESFYLYAFLPYVLLLANFYELGFSTDSLYFDGIMVWKKNIMSSFLYLRVIIFIVLSFIYFVFTILLLPNNAIFLSFFSVLMVTSMVSLLNFYVYSQRWDIMVNGKSLDDFNPEQLQYVYVLPYGSDAVPTDITDVEKRNVRHNTIAIMRFNLIFIFNLLSSERRFFLLLFLFY